MILRFNTGLGYESSMDVLIFLNNFFSTLVDPKIIKKNFKKTSYFFQWPKSQIYDKFLFFHH